MKYDFTSVPDRSRCGSAKWDAAPGASVERVPLSTADMEFPTAPQIVTALKKVAETTILGYTEPTGGYFDAVCGWMERRHDFHVDRDWIVTTPGVVYALATLVDALTEPEDSVIVIQPVYYPFDMAVLSKNRNIVYTDLKLEGTHYSIDYEDLEAKAARPDCKLLLFCNPHNPVGRVWTREELERVVDICDRNGVFIVDDEIHHDLIMPGYQHTVMATVSERAAQICAVCTAPSKTFNLAGLQCSNIIIPNPLVRAKVMAVHGMNLLFHLNSFAYPACEAAYNECEDWLEELLEVIAGNAKYIEDFMGANFPEVKVIPLEGTYLLWLDMRELGMTHVELEALMRKDAELYLDEGYIFGDAGRGFERINLACARVTLERSMERFKAAMARRRDRWTKEGKPYHKTLAAGDTLEGFVYDSPWGHGTDLARTIEKPTILLFSRYYTCSVCQATLAQLRSAWPLIAEHGFDLKVVMQSTVERVAEATAGDPFPFELICDPEAKLYDRCNVFEAGSDLAMFAGDPGLIRSMGGARSLVMAGPGGGMPEGRSRQLPALLVVGPDMTVRYAYYGKRINDLPDLQAVLASLA